MVVCSSHPAPARCAAATCCTSARCVRRWWWNPPGAAWSVYLMLAAVVTALVWAALTPVDVVTKAVARVVPEGREQLIASLEGGILRELKVREGDEVTPARCWPCWTRRAWPRSERRRVAPHGPEGRDGPAQAEANGTAAAVPEARCSPCRQVVQGETDSFEARERLLAEALDVNRRNLELLQRELAWPTACRPRA
jgi:adhesin transport system membrane fusion protein